MQFWGIIAKATVILIILWIIYGVIYYATSAYLGILDSEKVFKKCKFLGYFYFILFSLTSLEIIAILLYILGTAFKYILNFLWNIS